MAGLNQPDWSWPALVWLEAANTLIGRARTRAFHDISEMAGVSVSETRRKAKELRDKNRLKTMRFLPVDKNALPLATDF
jgi:hypothetical protein